MPMKKNAPSNKPSRKVRLAIIGTGGMAQWHAKKFQEIKECEIVAGMDIDPVKVKGFTETFDIPHGFTDIEELLSQNLVDAAVVATPDSTHCPLTLRCLKAGLHVLCEKPLALNYPDARKMLLAARKSGLIHMVNFSYRGMPCLQAVADVVQGGHIGEIRYLDASYLQAWLVSTVWGEWRTSPTWLWRLSSGHGSKGVLGDVGVHIIDFATFPAGNIRKVYCQLKTYPKAPRNRIETYKLDANDSAAMIVEFANGAMGTIQMSRWVGGHTNRLYLKIAGTKGTVEIDTDRGEDSYRICQGKDLHTNEWQVVKAKQGPSNYQRFIKAVRTGNPGQPDFSRGAEVQKVMDACFKSNETGKSINIR